MADKYTEQNRILQKQIIFAGNMNWLIWLKHKNWQITAANAYQVNRYCRKHYLAQPVMKASKYAQMMNST